MLAVVLIMYVQACLKCNSAKSGGATSARLAHLAATQLKEQYEKSPLQGVVDKFIQAHDTGLE